MTKERQEELEMVQPGINAYRALTECLDAIRQRDAQLTAAHDRERVLKEKVGKMRQHITANSRAKIHGTYYCADCSGPWVNHKPGCQTGQALAETEEKS